MATGVSRGRWRSRVQPPEGGDSQRSGEASLELSYSDKTPTSSVLAIPPAETVELWPGDETPSPNCLYFGDNLPILAGLLRELKVKGQVRLVYIDPPYATNGVFQSRCQSDAYQDLLGGAAYIEALRRRLILLRELLAEDGSIYVHLDQNMAFLAKLVMDEVFGGKGFRSWITRRKCNPKNYTRRTYGNVCDYILFYTKSNDYVWNRAYEEWTPERAAKEYSYVEEGTGRRYKKVPVHAPGVRNGKTGQPWRGKSPPPGKHWQYPPDKLDELDARGEIYWSPTGNPRRKIYFEGSLGVPVQDLWTDLPDAHNQMIKVTGYPTEKNPDLLSRIIRASSNEEDIVLDCYAGSGTTLAVASELGRRWIGIDSSAEAVRHMLHRFANGRERMGDFVRPTGPNTPSARKRPLSLFGDEATMQSREQLPARDRLVRDFSIRATVADAGIVRPLIDAWRQEFR